MNFGTKGKPNPFDSKNQPNPFDSKNQPDKSFNHLFKLLTASISNKMLEQDNQEAGYINDEAMEILDKVLELVNEREENVRIENDKFKSIISEINTALEDQMASTLEESMETVMENLDNWKHLVAKKENFEKMHQNLLQMKKNVLPMTFFRRQNKSKNY